MKRKFCLFLLILAVILTYMPIHAEDFFVLPTKKNKWAPVEKTGAGAIGGYVLQDGEDGQLQEGVAWPTTRFRDNLDGTVTDILTGLIWLKDACCDKFWFLDFTGQNKRNWSEALTAAHALANGYCGLSDASDTGDWRLPNVKELQSLLDYGRTGPALPQGYPFSNVSLTQYTWYVSSTTKGASGSSTDAAWSVDIFDGDVGAYNKNSVSFVWPVRGPK